VIITQTPLRVSLAGGGTDFPDYFRREGTTFISTAIDKYVFVIIKVIFNALRYSTK
jgi:D-glycero-alpha-D-manno-heptose-7-phosphate kinase